jgi:hypothetical protein
MARVEMLVDDVDGESVAKHSLTYKIGEQWKALDLSDEHYEQLMKAFEMFDDHARPLSQSEVFGDARSRRSSGRPRKQSGAVVQVATPGRCVNGLVLTDMRSGIVVASSPNQEV